MVRGYTASGGLAFGSGVVVANNEVITNCHVLRHTQRAWVTQGRVTYAIDSVKADRWHDLCLVHSEDLHLPVINIGSSNRLQPRQKIVSIGHSYGAPKTLLSAGKVQASYDFDGGKVIKTSARFAIGASGSGIFDMEGRLVGINTFKTPGRKAFFYALPVEWILALTQYASETELPIQGQAFWDSKTHPHPYFMQVAMPEIYGEWEVLLPIAQAWTQAEPLNTESWHSLGLAYTHLKREEDAEAAYRHAIALDRGHLESWFQLGLLGRNKQNASVEKEVSAHLEGFGDEVLAEYHQALAKVKAESD